MDELEQQAKMDVLKRLKDKASSALSGKLKGMQKVSVMSDSPVGLKKGLNMAEDVIDNKTPDEGGDDMHVPMHDKEAEMDEYVAKLSEEECEMLLDKLMAKKQEHENSAPANEADEEQSEGSDEY